MSAKKNGSISYRCTVCGHTHPKWMGRCPECGEWNSLAEYTETPASAVRLPGMKAAEPQMLSAVNPMESGRISTGITEFDLVLGGGAMKRSAILIGGEPGIGKSTLLLQAASAAGSVESPVLYISGEESAAQIRARADRIRANPDHITVLCASYLEDIEKALNDRSPAVTVIDSVQTVYAPEAGTVPGTINQLKYCTNALISWIKERDSVLFLTAHITKDGTIAGPKSLEHMVDTVISFERNNEQLRFLRAQKNRFGSVDELGIFMMEGNGLIPMKDPSALFMTRREGEIPCGAALAPVFEGSRVFLVEIQALTVAAKAGITRVYSDKVDSARVSRIAAVLEKCTGLKFSDQDIYINVAGGVRISESAVDAALAAALYSARTGIPVKASSALAGELSLAGEVRPVNRIKQRIRTARSLGIEKVYAPEEEEYAACITDVKSLVQAVFGNAQENTSRTISLSEKKQGQARQ